MNLENSASLTFMLAIYAFFGAPGLRLLAPQSRHGPLLARAARPVLCASPSLFSIEARAGGVAERSKAHAWKVCIRETVSRVRIPPPPPRFKYLIAQVTFT